MATKNQKAQVIVNAWQKTDYLRVFESRVEEFQKELRNSRLSLSQVADFKFWLVNDRDLRVNVEPISDFASTLLDAQNTLGLGLERTIRHLTIQIRSYDTPTAETVERALNDVLLNWMDYDELKDSIREFNAARDTRYTVKELWVNDFLGFTKTKYGKRYWFIS